MKDAFGKIRKILTALAAAAAGALILLRGEETAAAVRDGIELCFHSLIPSLFIFLVFAEFLIKTDVGALLFRPLGFLGKLFRIPQAAVPVLPVSLIGGYPAGARMLAELVDERQISVGTAERMLCFCVCCSPSFLIAGVSLSCFSSWKVGAAMYAGQTAAAILVGLLTRLFRDGECARHEAAERQKMGLAEGFVSAVSGAGRSLFSICCFAVFFFVVSRAVQVLPGGRVLAGLLEVTAGCAGLSGRSGMEKLLLASVYTSLGGACVWMQIACFLKGTGVRMRKFLLLRGVYAAVSLALTVLFVRSLAIPLPAFSGNSRPLPQAGAATSGASVLLVLLCLMLLISRGNYDKIEQSRPAASRCAARKE